MTILQWSVVALSVIAIVGSAWLIWWDVKRQKRRARAHRRMNS